MSKKETRGRKTTDPVRRYSVAIPISVSKQAGLRKGNRSSRIVELMKKGLIMEDGTK